MNLKNKFCLYFKTEKEEDSKSENKNFEDVYLRPLSKQKFSF